MQELQGHAKCLQHENYQLRAQVEKSCKLGRDVRDDNHDKHPIARYKGKEPIIFGDNDALANDELPSSTASRKECLRQHKGQIAKEALTPPCPQ